MKDIRSEAPPPTIARPQRRMFQKKTTPLSPAAVERQSRVTLLAWNRLGPDAAIAFLNSYDAGLGGRPLDMAVASQDGCERVERAIDARAVDELPD